jgi:glyoxylase-like metal-dependent hydrolase (beta-lactamase superfamily II)
MILGEFVVEQLSEGFFELFKDGSFVKMDPSRLNEPETDSTLGRYSNALGIDPLLVQSPEMNIIIDPGLGWGLDYQSRHKNTSNVVTNLDVFGLLPEDIDLVVLSHLHYDHSAGATYISDSLETTPTFPNAKYLLHEDEWAFALDEIENQERQMGAGYRLDELYRLAADGRFEFMKEEKKTISKGITILKTAGHTPGHLAVKLQSNLETAYYLGDLVPTEYHLNQYPMKMMDDNPVVAKKMKTILLREALREQAHLFFYHSLYRKSGKLAKDQDRQYILLDKKQKKL